MTTWNPSDKGAGVTLSNGDLTATFPDIGDQSVRSTTARTTGKWYFECTSDWTQVGTNSAQRIPGIMTATANLDSWAGSDTQGYGIRYHIGSADWLILFNGGSTVIGGSAVDGDVLGICLDLDNNFLYATHNGVALLGDPSALTGGQAIATDTWYAANSGGNGTPSITGNFGATAFAFGPPTGFTSWDIPTFDVSTPFFTHYRQVIGV
jgi:hypothetical protein